MEFRQLGRTGLKISEISLGTEYLPGQSRETVVDVVHTAIEHGVNYFDVIFSFPEYLDNLGAAFQGYRDRIFLAGHLGSTVKDGQYSRSRNIKKSETVFLDLLSRLGIDYVDILFLHNCDPQKDYDRLMKPNGQLDLARRFQQEGKAKFLGFSGHTVSTSLQAVESGHVDLLMFPINMAANAVPGKRDLLKACVNHNVGIIAMKPFAGGKLLRKDRTVKVSATQMGGEARKIKKARSITAVQCLAYALAQVGVTTTVPGCKDVDQLRETLAYLQATEEEKDFSTILADFQQYEHGECVYCNHCLPCPAAIDIGQTLRFLDMAQQRVTTELKAAYNALSAKASDCTECKACETRCPFGVHVIPKMQQTVALFEVS